MVPAEASTEDGWPLVSGDRAAFDRYADRRSQIPSMIPAVAVQWLVAYQLCLVRQTTPRLNRLGTI